MLNHILLCVTIRCPQWRNGVYSCYIIISSLPTHLYSAHCAADLGGIHLVLERLHAKSIHNHGKRTENVQYGGPQKPRANLQLVSKHLDTEQVTLPIIIPC